MTDNIIQFPNKRQLPPLPEVPNATENVHNLYRNNIECIIPPLTDFILDQLVAAGFKLDFTTDTYLKELCLVVEGLKGLLYKYYKLEHPLHEVADALFIAQDNIVSYKKKETDKEEPPPILKEEIIEEEDFDGYI